MHSWTILPLLLHYSWIGTGLAQAVHWPGIGLCRCYQELEIITGRENGCTGNAGFIAHEEGVHVKIK
jgi:hypothetical protein